jgi:hypothetical protein
MWVFVHEMRVQRGELTNINDKATGSRLHDRQVRKQV